MVKPVRVSPRRRRLLSGQGLLVLALGCGAGVVAVMANTDPGFVSIPVVIALLLGGTFSLAGGLTTIADAGHGH